MVTKKPGNTDNEVIIKTRFPANLTIRDVLTIITVIVTITLAWGVFSTRISILEKEVITLNVKVEEQKQDIKSLSVRTTKMEHQINENEIFIDEIYSRLKLPSPKHKYAN